MQLALRFTALQIVFIPVFADISLSMFLNPVFLLIDDLFQYLFIVDIIFVEAVMEEFVKDSRGESKSNWHTVKIACF